MNVNWPNIAMRDYDGRLFPERCLCDVPAAQPSLQESSDLAPVLCSRALRLTLMMAPATHGRIHPLRIRAKSRKPADTKSSSSVPDLGYAPRSEDRALPSQRSDTPC